MFEKLIEKRLVSAVGGKVVDDTQKYQLPQQQLKINNSYP
ncbi:hypothetical protein ES703_111174 [subsurface metagenome]